MVVRHGLCRTLGSPAGYKEFSQWSPQTSACVTTGHGFKVACDVESQLGSHLAVECDTHRKRSRRLYARFARVDSIVGLSSSSPLTPIILRPSHVPFPRSQCVIGYSVTGFVELIPLQERTPRTDSQDLPLMVTNYL